MAIPGSKEQHEGSWSPGYSIYEEDTNRDREHPKGFLTPVLFLLLFRNLLETSITMPIPLSHSDMIC